MYWIKFISLLKLAHLNFSVQMHIKKFNSTAGFSCGIQSFYVNVQKNIHLQDFGMAIMNIEPIN